MAHNWSDRTTYQGKAVNWGTRYLLEAMNTILSSPHFGGEKGDATAYQGGYNKGRVGASAGTHDGGGAVDLTPYNWKNRVKVLRILGTTGNHRTAIKGVWVEHIHFIVCGDGTASAAALRQVQAYYNGRNGLANNAKDPDWRPKKLPILFVFPEKAVGKPGVCWATKAQQMYDQPNAKGSKYGSLTKGQKFTVVAVVNVGGDYWGINPDGRCAPMKSLSRSAPTPPKPKHHVKVMTYNVSDKIASSPDTVAKVALSGDPYVIGFQEGGGRTAKKTPGEWMGNILNGLGDHWAYVTPTTDFNENWIAYRDDRVKLIGQSEDKIIRVAGAEGKHVTRVAFETPTGGRFAFGNTHLDPRRTMAGWNARVAQAELVQPAVADTSREFGGMPYVIGGDFNEAKFLPAFYTEWLTYARKITRGTSNPLVASYQGASATVRYLDLDTHKNEEWNLDHLVVPVNFEVLWFAIVASIKNGKMDPKAGDHQPVVASLSWEA